MWLILGWPICYLDSIQRVLLYFRIIATIHHHFYSSYSDIPRSFTNMEMMEPYRIKRQTLDPMDAVIHRYTHCNLASGIALILDRPISHPGQVYDPELMAYRPQRFSIASSRSSVSWNSTDFYPPSPRSSASSYLSMGSSPSVYSNYSTAKGTNISSWGSRRSSFTNIQRLRSTNPPPPVFNRLPQEIYDCILQQLGTIHSSTSTISCATCYLRDLCSLALTSRAWDRAVRTQL